MCLEVVVVSQRQQRNIGDSPSTSDPNFRSSLSSATYANFTKRCKIATAFTLFSHSNSACRLYDDDISSFPPVSTRRHRRRRGLPARRVPSRVHWGLLCSKALQGGAQLGYGGSSTVWLGRDQEGPGRLVTLEVMRADASSARTSEIPALVIPKCFEHPFCILFISRPLMIISSTKVRMALTCSLSFHSLALAFLLCRTVQDEQSGAGGCVRTWHAR